VNSKVSYDNAFFTSQMPISMRSASKILPAVFEVYKPTSILDVGCGTGVWLHVAQKLGVEEILGVDGDYVDKELLAISPAQFLSYDLKESLLLNRKFDLVISSEVAEHLPFEVSEKFVESLINHSDYVLFSAAAPGQEGTYHINEQPQQFWVDIFAKKGYLPLDFIRSKFWNTYGVDWWYKQNMFLFVKADLIDSNAKFKTIYEQNKKLNYNLVHPEMIYNINKIKSPISRLIKFPQYTIGKLLSYIFKK